MKKAIKEYIDFMEEFMVLAKANPKNLEEIMILEGLIEDGKLSKGFKEYKKNIFKELAITEIEKEKV